MKNIEETRKSAIYMVNRLLDKMGIPLEVGAFRYAVDSLWFVERNLSRRDAKVATALLCRNFRWRCALQVHDYWQRVAHFLKVRV